MSPFEAVASKGDISNQRYTNSATDRLIRGGGRAFTLRDVKVFYVNNYDVISVGYPVHKVVD
jgi:hypothetical protein